MHIAFQIYNFHHCCIFLFLFLYQEFFIRRHKRPSDLSQVSAICSFTTLDKYILDVFYSSFRYFATFFFPFFLFSLNDRGPSVFLLIEAKRHTVHRETVKPIESAERQDPWSFRLDDVTIALDDSQSNIHECRGDKHRPRRRVRGCYDRDLNGPNQNRNDNSVPLYRPTLSPVAFILRSYEQHDFSFIFPNHFQTHFLLFTSHSLYRSRRNYFARSVNIFSSCS